MFGDKLTKKDRQQQAYIRQDEPNTVNTPKEKIVYVPMIMDAMPTWGYHLETRAPDSLYGRYDSQGYTLSQSEATAFVEKHYNNRASLVKLYVTEDGRLCRTHGVQLVDKHKATV